MYIGKKMPHTSERIGGKEIEKRKPDETSTVTIGYIQCKNTKYN